MEHSLAYQAIAQGAVDVIDVYSTDAKIREFKLRVLQDNLNYFPSYQAVWVARADFVNHIRRSGRHCASGRAAWIQATMQDLNGQVDLAQRRRCAVAAVFADPACTRTASPRRSAAGHSNTYGWWERPRVLVFGRRAAGDIGGSLPQARAGILTLSAITQTVPSLALLCFLIPVFGVGAKPALAALCLYSLLPVVLNTFTGLRGIDPRHIETPVPSDLRRGKSCCASNCRWQVLRCSPASVPPPSSASAPRPWPPWSAPAATAYPSCQGFP